MTWGSWETVPPEGMPSGSQPPVAGGHRFSAVSGSCAIDEQGRAWCWGAGEHGQLGGGPGSQAPADTPVAVTGSERFAAVSTGFDHTCALNESGMAWCWGNNHHRQVGGGQTANETAFTPQPVDAKYAFTAVSAGRDHSCALDEAGQAWCWGSDVTGQLGAGTAGANTGVPVRVEGLTAATSVAASWNHSCAVDTAGQAWCWGSDDSGQLGNGNNTAPNEFFPTAVVGSHVFAAVTTGVSHTCALDKDGQAWCWGDGAFGVLGAGYLESDPDSDSGAVTERSPVAVAGEHVFARITAGGHHSCALDSSGAAWCWGMAQDGQLGSGPGEVASTISLRPTPHRRSLVNITSPQSAAVVRTPAPSTIAGARGAGARTCPDNWGTEPSVAPTMNRPTCPTRRRFRCLAVSPSPRSAPASTTPAHWTQLDRRGAGATTRPGNSAMVTSPRTPKSRRARRPEWPVTSRSSPSPPARSTPALWTPPVRLGAGAATANSAARNSATPHGLHPNPVRVQGTQTFDPT